MRSYDVPPQVDFEAIAEQALAAGIFAVSAEVQDPDSKMPTSMLDAYGPGVFLIEAHQVDMPVAAMNAVRKNFAQANKLLVPTDQLGLYFHQRFTNGDVMGSESLQHVIDDYQPYQKLTNLTRNTAVESFNVNDPARKNYRRKQYSAEEIHATWDFAIECPEAILSILAYQAVVTDYFAELRQQYDRQLDGDRVSARDLELFDGYAAQWNGDNFSAMLVPALTILHHNAKKHNPSLGAEFFDEQVFSQAFALAADNGAFRNWVPVPAYVAADGKERVNKFLCPAAGTLKEQLGDGTILAKTYGLVRRSVEQGDLHTTEMLDKISELSRTQQDTQTMEEIEAELLKKYREEDRYQLDFDGVSLSVRVDFEEYTMLEGDYVVGDHILTYTYADDLSDVFCKAIASVMEDNQPVSFEFNDVVYRVTPERLRAIASAQYPDKKL